MAERRHEEAERLSADEVRALLDREHPWPDEPAPPRLYEPERYAAWKRERDEVRRARHRLAAEHGWTVLDLLREQAAQRERAAGRSTDPEERHER